MEAHNVIITKKNEVYIKIDCEGHDKEILPTLKNIIEINKPIIQTEIYDGLSNKKIIIIDRSNK